MECLPPPSPPLSLSLLAQGERKSAAATATAHAACPLSCVCLGGGCGWAWGVCGNVCVCAWPDLISSGYGPKRLGGGGGRKEEEEESIEGKPALTPTQKAAARNQSPPLPFSTESKPNPHDENAQVVFLQEWAIFLFFHHSSLHTQKAMPLMRKGEASQQEN